MWPGEGVQGTACAGLEEDRVFRTILGAWSGSDRRPPADLSQEPSVWSCGSGGLCHHSRPPCLPALHHLGPGMTSPGHQQLSLSLFLSLSMYMCAEAHAHVLRLL